MPQLTNLTPGVHGFHVHQNPDCAAGTKDGKQVPGLAAGGHYDPANAAKHEVRLAKVISATSPYALSELMEKPLQP